MKLKIGVMGHAGKDLPVVIIGGKSGTLGEFAIAYDEGKLIGVLMGTGGITTEIKHLIRIIRKDTGAKVLYDRDPRRLIHRLWQYYHREHYKHPSCFRNELHLLESDEDFPDRQEEV
jgi:hypothetical protein